MLSVRELKIANKLFSIKKKIRISELSDSLYVSERTIKYDLENIRDFLSRYNIVIHSKKGNGIWVEADDETRKTMLSILESEGSYCDPSMRIQKILMLLLVNKGFITAAALAEQLMVSRNTALKDLRYAGKILADSGLTLHGKKNSGYIIIGDERKLRDFFELHIQKCLSVYDVYQITSRIKSPDPAGKPNIYLSEFFGEYYRITEDIMAKVFNENTITKLQNENILLMIIRLLITLVRVRGGHIIGNTAGFSDIELSTNYLYPYWVLIFEHSKLPVYKDEFHYIAGVCLKNSGEIDIVKLTSALIKEVSEKQGFPYYKDVELYTRLISHLAMSINEDIMANPFNDVLLKKHCKLFQTIREICAAFIQNSRLLLDDSFIAYIVLHFLTSKRTILSAEKVRAVLICATGRGAVKLIKKNIESEVKDIEVVANCSLVETEHTIKEIQPDMLISIFPIEAGIPVVIVNPVPSKENLEAIKETARQLKNIPSVSDDMDGLLSFNNKPQNSEEISQQIILSGLNIYRQLENYPIKKDLEFAFLSHIMLFAHRHWFDKQYEHNRSFQGHEELRKILSNAKIHISDAELDALLKYIE